MISSECNGCEYQCNLSHIDICTLGSPCPHQRSTPMTNEEWFFTLSTEEKAKVFANATYSSACLATEILFFGKEAEQKKWERWLKEKHHD